MGTTTKRVVIVGCGIAGPVLGMFLRRIGIEVVICERRARDAGNDGAFLGVAPNGMNVLAELGLADEVATIGHACRAFAFLDARGRRIGEIDRSRDDARFGASLQMVRRRDLHEVLTEAAIARGVEVQFGRTLVGIDRSDPRRVVARFDVGRDEGGDALFGCDGIGSSTRAVVLPDAPAPAYSGLVDFAGFARCPAAALPMGVNAMVFGRRAFFGGFRTQSDEVWWFHNAGAKHPADVSKHPTAMRERILELHAEDPPWICDVVEATPVVLGPFPLNDILALPRWHAGRVCLLGDAAHATTPSAGQGASMALEDAMVVARCLRDFGDPSRAFVAFEHERRARVEAIVKASRRNGSGKTVSGPIAEWLRDRLLPLFLRLGAKGQDRTYAHRISWDRSVDA